MTDYKKNTIDVVKYYAWFRVKLIFRVFDTANK